MCFVVKVCPILSAKQKSAKLEGQLTTSSSCSVLCIYTVHPSPPHFQNQSISLNKKSTSHNRLFLYVRNHLPEHYTLSENFGGGGSLSQIADMLTLCREWVEELKHRASVAVKYLKLSIKLMNFFTNHVKISFNTAPTPFR